ncbi:MAG: DNA polymerase, partial [Thermomicrobiales bacterium]|nr:DNA polymerase [Thermomicrobiales bacterium]
MVIDAAAFQQTSDANTSLTGRDSTPHILAVEPAGGSAVHLYRRDDAGRVVREELRSRPWLVATRAEPWAALKPAPEIARLNGDHPLKFLVTFAAWTDFLEATRAARESRETYFSVNSPVDQHLIMSGRTLFKGMVFQDLRRLQIDLETTGLDPLLPDARIVIAAIRTPEGEELAFSGRSEEAILVDLSEAIRRIDPDVIEGHNIFNFDLPFIVERAARWSVELRWGRDNSLVRLGQRRQRVKVGPLSVSFQPAFVSGRHIVDTYQQIQRYDVGGRLTSYGLKPAIEALGLQRDVREFVPGEQIRDVWRSDPDRLVRYALDDVRDVDALSRLTLPTEFYQTQLLPRPLQQVATTGPGTKINDLMLRAYLQQMESLPLPGASRDYPGGHAELIASGVFSPVVKCDVESLYPSLMLAEQITSARDTLGVYLPMLRELTRRRLHAKSRSRLTSGQEQAVWEGLQASFKVLINSFYGYLGFGGALFNDYEAATKVTLAGQRVIKAVVAGLESTESIPIEVDTDGVYFVPPASVQTEEDEFDYVAMLGQEMPSGVRLAHDGRYRAMLSLHLKNYARLGYDDRLTLKGSALRSRRLEPFVRDFLVEAARAFVEGRREDA